MPWEETDTMNERMKFVAALESGASMSELCRSYGISRKTGYKIWDRFKRLGLLGLYDGSRRPERLARRLPDELERLIIDAKQRYPHWGSKKLRDVFERENAGVRSPARSTFDEVLKRHGLVTPRRRKRRTPIYAPQLIKTQRPNQLWCADFKGQFRLANRQYCYPLTITDQHSRFLLCCEAMEGTFYSTTRQAFEAVFVEHGLPEAIRTDNGPPFASRGLHGLSQLSAWWLSLGITPERIVPGHPEQNGRHERMHLTLKREATRPAAQNGVQQQERFDLFVDQFNRERPHEALEMKRPAEVHERSERNFQPTPRLLDYPLHDDVKRISGSGHISFGRKHRYFLSTAIAGYPVGLRELQDNRLLVSFATLDLGFIDLGQRIFEALDSPSAPQSSAA